MEYMMAFQPDPYITTSKLYWNHWLYDVTSTTNAFKLLSLVESFPLSSCFLDDKLLPIRVGFQVLVVIHFLDFFSKFCF